VMDAADPTTVAVQVYFFSVPASLRIFTSCSEWLIGVCVSIETLIKLIILYIQKM